MVLKNKQFFMLSAVVQPRFDIPSVVTVIADRKSPFLVSDAWWVRAQFIGSVNKRTNFHSTLTVITHPTSVCYPSFNIHYTSLH